MMRHSIIELRFSETWFDDEAQHHRTQVGSVDIQISTLPDEISFPVKQTTLRLEKGLSDELQGLCQREQICREVLIEAMFLELLGAPELREEIIARARERQRKRTAVANHKRALSMVQRVSNQF